MENKLFWTFLMLVKKTHHVTPYYIYTHYYSFFLFQYSFQRSEKKSIFPSWKVLAEHHVKSHIGDSETWLSMLTATDSNWSLQLISQNRTHALESTHTAWVDYQNQNGRNHLRSERKISWLRSISNWLIRRSISRHPSWIDPSYSQYTS